MRREQEELKRKLEEERRAREEAERRAAEEAKRLEEERRKLEAERKAREEERRREDEERAQRRIQEERERAARRRQEQKEAEERPRSKQKEPEPEPEPVPAPKAAPASGGFSDTLLADLESFNTRDEQEQKEREEAVRKEKEAAAARAEAERKAAEERRAKEEAEREQREEKQRRKQEEAERKAREEAELREREEREKQRLKEEEEKRKKEAEEREKKAKQEERLAASATRASSGGFDAEMRAKRERDLMSRSRATATAARAQRKGWGRPIAISLFVLLVVALGVAHVMPIDTADYERAASEALGRPVKIGSARLSLFTGLQVKLSEVNLGEGVILPEVRAFPEFDAVLGPRKAFSRIEIDRLKLEQEALGQALFVKVKGDNFSVARVAARNIELTGPLALPKGLEFELIYDGEGHVRSAVVRGPDALLARLSLKGQAMEFDMSSASFTLPFAPEITFSKFSAKGTATAQGLQVAEWDAALLNGTVSGTANVRWGESWIVDGVVTARNINAAVFAPALLSDGKGEGSGKFSMRGAPGKLASTGRLDGSFTVTRGVLGSIDLSRAIQTGGKSATGRTQFNEMNGQGTYDRGAVSLRNVTIGAGQLNAGASADISQNGALSGRIVADVKVAQQRLSATLNLGGTVKEPQVRN
jgi:AsmA-like C-terminal region